VLFIYRLIPRKLDLLERLAIFDITPISRFWGLLVMFTAAYNINVLVSVYQSIGMHCIVLSVKFDYGLFILILRNKQLFYKPKLHRFMQTSACYLDPNTCFVTAQSYSNSVFPICPCGLPLRGEFLKGYALYFIQKIRVTTLHMIRHEVL
jgi:hypothetical protein